MRVWLRCSAVLLGLALTHGSQARASSSDALREAAAHLNEVGEYRRAAQLLEAIRISDPAEPKVYVHLAVARAGLRQYRAAAGAVRVGLERAAERGDSVASESLLEHQRGAVESLLDHARTVLRRGDRVRLLGRMDSILVLPSRAEALLSDTTRLFPEGMANLDEDDAIECFGLARQMNPSAAKPFAFVASEYILLERWADAQKALNEGLKLAPEDRDLRRLWDQANRRLQDG